MARARATLAAGRGAAEFRDWPLGPNLGQCCGGMVRTLTETFDAADLAAVRRFEEVEQSGAFATASRLDANGRIVRVLASRAAAETGRTAFSRTSFHERFGEAATPVLLFGAGHVGRAVVLALAPLPFTVRWIDGRQDQFPQHVPQNAVALCTDDPTHELAQAPRDAIVIVMTHSHPLDFDITAAALQRDAFDFVGLIGSETKRARFASWARQLGVAESRIDWLVCPIGILQIRGKEPAVIAAGIAAQLLIVRERASAPLVSPATQPT
jgi:xanthine dehydrogenase accessory factor